MKTFLLILTITCGVFLPYGHNFAFMIKYILMLLLLFAFLNIKINRKIIHKIHFVLLGINILFPVILYFILLNFNETLAEIAFITSITPSAIASPVVTSLLHGKVEFPTFSLLLNNFTIALLLPVMVPALLHTNGDISTIKILLPILTVFLIPLALSQILKFGLPNVHKKLAQFSDYSFYLLIIGIYLGTSKASYYVSNNLASSLEIVFAIGAITLFIVIFYFSLGKLIGGKEFSQEAGQALGQKNNGFTIWIALTFISPLAVLGPVFYVLFQNIYISWQLYQAKKVRDRVFH